MKALLTYFIPVLLFVGLAQAINGCTKEVGLQTNIDLDCDTIPASYSNVIKPLVARTCMTGQGPGTGCHDAWIGNYNSLKGKVNNGTLELRVVQQMDMPPPGNTFGIPVLTDEEIAQFVCWMAGGAKED